MSHGVGFDLQNCTGKNDGIIRRALYNDGILTGCGASNTNNSMTVAAGQFMICGRAIELLTAETTTIATPPSSGVVRLKYVLDMTQTPSEEEFTQGAWDYEYAASLSALPALVQQDINASGETYEIEFMVYSIAGGNISTLLRSIKHSAPSGWNDLPYPCVYISATSFKIEGVNLTEILRYGVKFRATQGGVDKNFYIVDSQFSTDTTITVTGEVDLASGTIETPKYSIVDVPEGFKKGELWYRANAKCSTAQSITQGTDSVKIALNTEIYDPNNNFDNASPNYYYTAPISGYYLVDAHMTMATIAATFEIMMSIMGLPSAPVRMQRTIAAWSASGYCTMSGSRVVYLPKGTIIYLGVYQGSAGARTLDANQSTLSVQFLHV